MRACVCVCVRACVGVCVCACVCLCAGAHACVYGACAHASKAGLPDGGWQMLPKTRLSPGAKRNREGREGQSGETVWSGIGSGRGSRVESSPLTMNITIKLRKNLTPLNTSQ